MDGQELPEQGSEIDPARGFCIEISCLPDGTFNVSVEPLEQAANEPSESKGEQASSIADALRLAVSMYKQVSEGGGGDGDFEAGFSGKPTPVSKPGMMA